MDCGVFLAWTFLFRSFLPVPAHKARKSGVRHHSSAILAPARTALFFYCQFLMQITKPYALRVLRRLSQKSRSSFFLTAAPLSALAACSKTPFVPLFVMSQAATHPTAVSVWLACGSPPASGLSRFLQGPCTCSR